MSEKKVTAAPDTEASPQTPGPVIPFAELTARVAGEFAIEPKALWDALKTEFFPGGAASDAQMFLVLQIMDRYKLNPFMHEMYAAISKKTGKLLIGLQYDGFNVIAHRHPKYKGFHFEYVREAGQVTAVICKVYRDDWEHPGEYYAEMREWKIATETWQQRPVHQLCVKAFNNCVKLTLGLSGLYDWDDIERIQASENKPAIETVITKIETKVAAQTSQPGQIQKGAAHVFAATNTSESSAPAASAMDAIREAQQNPREPDLPSRPISAPSDIVVTHDSGEGEREIEGVRAQQGNGRVRDELSKLIDRTPPARVNLLLGQQGVSRVEDLNEEQAAIIIARLSKGGKVT